MQTIRVVLIATLFGLFGLARPFVNCSAQPGASPDIRTGDQRNMSNSISTLLLRNLSDVFGEMTPCVVALQSMRCFTKTQYSMTCGWRIVISPISHWNFPSC
jgi:hypothetical protein